MATAMATRPMAGPGPTFGRLDYPSAAIYLQASTAIEKRFRLNACQKEPWTASWLERLPTDARLWNVGANVGSYALIAGARGILTLAFEPAFANYAALCLNAAVNGLHERVAALPLALGAETKIGNLQYRSFEAGAGSHLHGGTGGVVLPAMTFRGDDLIEEWGAPSPTHLLIDVDGAEAAVLQGMPEALRNVDGALIEVGKDPFLTRRVARLLGDAGLELAERIDDESPRFKHLWYGIWERA
jgi:FkbM family methyltransferase